MRVVNMRPVGKALTYTLEVDHPTHNYLVKVGDRTICSRNSHASAYIVITYRCLYLKAHFPQEWWAAVMSHCHREKLPKFISVARSEGVKFGDIDANAISSTFTVNGDTVVPGIKSVKGVGQSIMSKVADKGYTYASIDEFVDKHGKCKVLIEPVIKMGGFRHHHTNKRALWYWYLFKYDGDTGLRNRIKYCWGWTPEAIKMERERLTTEFQSMYPKRKKLPTNVVNWVPNKPVGTPRLYSDEIAPTPEEIKQNSKLNITFDHVLTLFSQDFTLSEILNFEKKVLGFWWHSPLDVYQHDPARSLKTAKKDGILEAVIEDATVKQTARSTFVKAIVTDGIDKASLMIWSNELANIQDGMLETGVGIRVEVEWQDKYRSFNVIRGSIIIPLAKKI